MVKPLEISGRDPILKEDVSLAERLIVEVTFDMAKTRQEAMQAFQQVLDEQQVSRRDDFYRELYDTALDLAKAVAEGRVLFEPMRIKFESEVVRAKLRAAENNMLEINERAEREARNRGEGGMYTAEYVFGPRPAEPEETMEDMVAKPRILPDLRAASALSAAAEQASRRRRQEQPLPGKAVPSKETLAQQKDRLLDNLAMDILGAVDSGLYEDMDEALEDLIVPVIEERQAELAEIHQRLVEKLGERVEMAHGSEIHRQLKDMMGLGPKELNARLNMLVGKMASGR